MRTCSGSTSSPGTTRATPRQRARSPGRRARGSVGGASTPSSITSTARSGYVPAPACCRPSIPRPGRA
eukprot:13573928-Alexandrium_andersonii.AAC.1